MLGDGSSAECFWGLFRNGWSPAVGLGFPQHAKKPPATQETQKTQVQSQGCEDPLQWEMATYSRILAWRIPWTEELGRLQPTGSQRARHDSSWAHAYSFEPTRGHAVLPGAPMKERAVRAGPKAASTFLQGQGSPWMLAREDQERGRTVRVICSAWHFAELMQYLGMRLYIQSKDLEHAIFCVLPIWQVKQYSFIIWTGIPLFIKMCLPPHGLVDHLYLSLLCSVQNCLLVTFSSQSSVFLECFWNLKRQPLFLDTEFDISQIYWYFIMWFGSSKSLFFIYLPCHELKMVN